MEGHSLHHHENEEGRTVRGYQRELLIALTITTAIMIAELVGGLLSNSLALLSDAAHMFTDVLALLLSILAFRFSGSILKTSSTKGRAWSVSSFPAN